MRGSRWHWFVYWVLLRGGQGVAIIVTAVIGVSFQEYLQRHWPEFLKGVVSFFQGFAWVLPICAVYLAVASLAARYLKPPHTWVAIQDFLDNLWEYFFTDIVDRGEPGHHHRVTLFKWTKWTWNPLRWHITWSHWRWPWSGWWRCPRSGWFVPVARSGHTTLRSSTRFWANPNKPTLMEGIPGLVWERARPRTKYALIIRRLPQLDANATEVDLTTYANATRVQKEWLEKRIRDNKPIARSFCGIPVEVKNKLWGVIVLDSQKEELPNSEELIEVYGLSGRLLGNLLQGG
jgi:hypothetical protein